MKEKSGLIFLLPVAGYVLYFAKLVLCVSLPVSSKKQKKIIFSKILGNL